MKMKMKIKLDHGAYLPDRAHDTDAGLDLRAMCDSEVPAYGSATFDTGVHVQIPEGYVGDIKSKSGLMVNHKITTDGTIDSGYIGSIRVILFNHSPIRYDVKAGQKIAQLVIKKIITPELEIVGHLGNTARGNGGFGSTGKF
jgi:dUTP pyrophosphatase